MRFLKAYANTASIIETKDAHIKESLKSAILNYRERSCASLGERKKEVDRIITNNLSDVEFLALPSMTKEQNAIFAPDLSKHPLAGLNDEMFGTCYNEPVSGEPLFSPDFVGEVKSPKYPAKKKKVNEIILDSVKLRDYQEEILYAVEELGYRKIFLCLARRGGKDYLAWWIAIRYAIKNVCLVTYALPTFGQAKKCIFEAIDSDGRSFLSLIPKELIARINVSEQKIVLTNGSIISCVGTENHDTSIRGSNPKLVVLSEYAYMDSDVLDTVRPILANNGGTLIVVSTPFSKNHFFDLMCMAKQMPDWYVVYKNVYETKHISDEVLAEERAQMTKEKFAQEYECSFESGEGFYYTRQLETIRQKGQITNVEWDPSLLVYVAIDIGVKDATTMVFYSVLPGAIQIRILDCYSNTGQGVEHYIAKIQEKQMKWFGALGLTLLLLIEFSSERMGIQEQLLVLRKRDN